MIHSRIHPLVLSIMILVASISLPLLSSTSSLALSGNDFKPGRIIDDGVFYNKNSMSAVDIQRFLDAKVPTCDTWGTQPYAGTTRGEYARSRGYPPPFRCVKEYWENPTTKENNLDGRATPAGAQSAAQIIWNVGQQYSINPQVLIVLLEKEQGLIRDDWPWTLQYRSATGYGCPDTAPCDAEYYGFYNQVSNAARQFRRYATYPYEYNFIPFANNFVQWNPNASCGGSNVYIENQATASLYNYTPYQPNQAALNNLYGSGDSCSAYGNRNFWRLFNEWFGSGYTDPYTSSYVSQAPYPSVSPGQQTTVYITYKNIGSATWYDDHAVNNGLAPTGSKPTRLATANPVNRSSTFGQTWGNDKNRPTGIFKTVYGTDGSAYATNPHIVKPGESAKFEFTITVPSGTPTGSYTEYFQPVVEGFGTINSPAVFLKINVQPVYSAAYVDQSAYPTIKAGDSKQAYFTYKNTGNVSWYDDHAVNGGLAPTGTKPTRLATANPVNRSSNFGSSWGGDRNRATGTFGIVYREDGSAYTTNPHIVKPGESVRFNFTLTAPENFTATTSREDFAPIVEGVGLMPITTFLNVTVPVAATAKATSSTTSLTITPLAEKEITVTFENTGNTTWSKDSTVLQVVDGDASSLRSTGWISNTEIVKLNEQSVAPGASGSFTFVLSAPQDGGTHSFKLAPAINSVPIGLSTQSISVNVPAPVFSAKYYSQSAYPTIDQNSTRKSYFMFKNVGNTPWHDVVSRPTGIKPVVLATTAPINRISKLNANFATSNRAAIQFASVFEEDGTTIASNQHIVQPGQIAKFEFTFTAPNSLAPGTYREWFQPVLEGGNPWDMGASAFLDVTVRGATHKASYRGQSPYPTIATAQQATGYFMFENTGTATWRDARNAWPGAGPVVLATTNPINRLSKFNSLFDTANRPTIKFSAVYENNGTTLSTNQEEVRPGQVAKFEFLIKPVAGTTPGTYREWFQPVLEGGNPWDMGGYVFLDIRVTQ